MRSHHYITSEGLADVMKHQVRLLHVYTCQLSHLGHESHACGLKTLISRRLSPAGQFLTPDWKMWVVAVLLVNSDPCKERKPCVKWINDNTFLAISDFWSEKHWERARIETGTGTSNVFGRLRTSSGIFGNDRVIIKNHSTPRIKISCLYLRKSWQVYM